MGAAMVVVRFGWLLGMAMGGALWINSAVAQVTPDGTLGAESSIVIPNVEINGVNSDRIDGGATRGSNLFHSFKEFNVGENRGAYFSNPDGITNIISRVTGGSASNIHGTLGVLGSANLFFINPSGIIFGRSARLDVGGSFIGSTASSIQFGEQGFFSATNPTNNVSLLTINPSALFFNQIASPIQNNSVAQAGVDPAGFPALGLRVPDGNNLLLIGGNINMDGGSLSAYGGHIELAGLASSGSIGLNEANNTFSLSVPEKAARADISMINGAQVNVTAANGGSITLNASSLQLSGQSQLLAGIGQGQRGITNRAGDIVIDGENISLNQSLIYNYVNTGATGHSGDIRITTGSLALTNAAEIETGTFGRGNAGSVTIEARDTVSLDNQQNISDLTTDIGSIIYPGGIGNAGGLQITVGSLTLVNGAVLATDVYPGGQGNAGNITIQARNQITLSGKSIKYDIPSLIISRLAEESSGKAGNINITADSLSILTGGIILSISNGQGDSGNITLGVNQNIVADGEGFFSSFFASPVGIRTFTNTRSKSNAGNIDITVGGSLLFTRGAGISSSTNSQGDAGSINIQARDTVSFDGINSIDRDSGISTRSRSRATGKAGDINIIARELRLTGGAYIQSTAESADSPAIDQAGNARRGGNITITSNILKATDGSQIRATTRSSADAGSIILNVADMILLSGTNPNYDRLVARFPPNERGVEGPNGGVFANASTGSTGSVGNVYINTRQLDVLDNSIITVSNQGTGRGGNLNINAEQIALNNQGKIIGEAVSSNGGSVALRVKKALFLRHKSLISTTAGTAQQPGDGGNINITAPNGFIIAIPNENSDITANAFTGAGGRVNIEAQGIFGIAARNRTSGLSDITATSELGIPGVVQTSTPNTDFSLGLVELPLVLADTSDLVDTGCAAMRGGEESEFIVTGRGGLPPNPFDALDTDVTWTDTRVPKKRAGEQRSRGAGEQKTSSRTHSLPPSLPPGLTPATGWVFKDNGEVTLVSDAGPALAHRCAVR
jgi:filamentous hemagglutinin family protein